MTELRKPLNDFLKWLELNHPEVLKKYSGNFNIPVEGGDSFSVNDNNKISRDEYEMLCRIVDSYQSTLL